MTESKASICALDCPDTCSLEVTVTENQITRLRGSQVNPYTAGVVCNKVVQHYPAFVHGDYRLRQPLIRTGARGSGAFQPTTWENALTLIAEKTKNLIHQYGSETVLPLNYAGPTGQLAGGSMDRRFFHKMGATLVDRGPLCGAVRNRAYSSLFGNAPGMPPELLVKADTIAIWGSNITVSNLHLARVIKQAREQGTRLVVIDPKRTRIAEQAQLYLQIAPGTDVVLAQALAAEMERRNAIATSFVQQWVDSADIFLTQCRQYSLQDAAAICGLPLQSIEQLADAYAGAKNLGCVIGNGIERGRCGGSALRSIMSVSVLLGQLGRPGAGIFAKPGLAFATTTDRLQRPDLIPHGTRKLNIVDLGKHLLMDDLDPPLRAIFIYNHNPVATHPDQNRMIRALSRPELFITGIDVVMTDSMKYCDVILPAASHFECDDIYAAYGHSYLQRAEPVIPCVAESLPNTEIFRRLAQSFGYQESLFKESDAELMDAAIDPKDPALAGNRPSTLPTDQAFLCTKSGADLIMCQNVMPATSSGKIELYSQALEDEYGFGLPRYHPAHKDRSFTVISPASSARTNATFGCMSNTAIESVEINPEDAEAAGIQTGDRLQLENDCGAVMLKAKVTSATRPGVLYTPKGTWLGSSETNRTINALISADMKADIVDGACYNETFVEITRITQATE